MPNTYAYKVPLKADRYQLFQGKVVSTNEGIQVGVLPDSNSDAEYVERQNPETGDILWCNADDYYEDSQGLLEFLSGEGIEGNPFTETT